MDISILTIIYFLAWLLTFLFFIRKNKKKEVGAYTVIVVSYVVYAFFSILYYGAAPELFEHITFFPFLYLYILLMIALLPVRQYDTFKVKGFIGVNRAVCYMVFSIFLITTLIVIPSTITQLQESFFILLTEDDGAIQLYNEMHAQDTSNSYLNGGIIGICTVIRYLLYEICVFLFFYYLTFPRKNLILILLLLLSFFIDILISFAKGGRTVSTMEAFTILMTYLIFERYLGDSVNRATRKVLLVLGGGVVMLTLVVTISRSLNREGGAGEGIIEYVGQANLLFNEEAFDSNNLRDGDRTCNVFKRLLGFDNVPKSITGVRDKHASIKLSDRNFSTFIGDFVLDFGPFATALIIMLFTFVFLSMTRPRRGVLHLEQLLLIQLVADICMHGGMYLFYYSFSGNYILMMYVLFAIVLKMSSNGVLIQARQ